MQKSKRRGKERGKSMEVGREGERDRETERQKESREMGQGMGENAFCHIQQCYVCCSSCSLVGNTCVSPPQEGKLAKRKEGSKD